MEECSLCELSSKETRVSYDDRILCPECWDQQEG